MAFRWQRGRGLRLWLRRTHHRDAALAHDGFDVFEVGVDNAQFLDDGGDAVHGVAQDVIHGFEGADEGRVFAHDGGDAVVRDDDEAIDFAFQHFQPRFGFAHARHAFKGKRFGDDGDGEDAHVARDVGDDGCGAGTGTAAHAAAMKTMSAPFKASRILSRSSSAAARPTSGLEPAPMPRVVLTPSCSLF